MPTRACERSSQDVHTRRVQIGLCHQPLSAVWDRSSPNQLQMQGNWIQNL